MTCSQKTCTVVLLCIFLISVDISQKPPNQGVAAMGPAMGRGGGGVGAALRANNYVKAQVKTLE